MISLIPPFLEGEHYRELSPAEGGNRNRFETILPPSILLAKDPRVRLSFRDAADREWLRIDRRLITVSARYAWNGNSPKRHVPVFGWIGTPDPVRTRLASCFHDALGQFGGVPEMPFDQKEIDQIFLGILLRSRFTLARTWHGAVSDFGGIFTRRGEGLHAVPLSPVDTASKV